MRTDTPVLEYAAEQRIRWGGGRSRLVPLDLCLAAEPEGEADGAGDGKRADSQTEEQPVVAHARNHPALSRGRNCRILLHLAGCVCVVMRGRGGSDQAMDWIGSGSLHAPMAQKFEEP
jgi:hypothetical protein